MRRLTGVLLLFAVFGGIFVYSGVDRGWGYATMAFLAAIGICFVVFVATWLLWGDRGS